MIVVVGWYIKVPQELPANAPIGWITSLLEPLYYNIYAKQYMVCR